MSKLRGFTLIELLIVVAIIAILAAIAVPNFLEAQTRSKVSRVRSDHRSMATAIETYYVDNNEYPAWSDQVSEHVDEGQYGATVPNNPTPGATFYRRIDGTNTLSTLTTPISYITSYFPDPFADVRGTTFRYFSVRQGWILGSWGPDVDQATGGDLVWDEAVNDGQLTAGSVETYYDPSEFPAQPSEVLLTGGDPVRVSDPGTSPTYDPTNGTVSQGDVWRVKQ